MARPSECNPRWLIGGPSFGRKMKPDWLPGCALFHQNSHRTALAGFARRVRGRRARVGGISRSSGFAGWPASQKMTSIRRSLSMGEAGAVRRGFREVSASDERVRTSRPAANLASSPDERRAPMSHRGLHSDGRAIRENRAVPHRPRLHSKEPDWRIEVYAASFAATPRTGCRPRRRQESIFRLMSLAAT